MEAHLVAGSELGRVISRPSGQHSDHRIATGDRMVGEEDQRLASRGNLDRATDQTLRRQFMCDPPVQSRTSSRTAPGPRQRTQSMTFPAAKSTPHREPVAAGTGSRASRLLGGCGGRDRRRAANRWCGPRRSIPRLEAVPDPARTGHRWHGCPGPRDLRPTANGEVVANPVGWAGRPGGGHRVEGEGRVRRRR